MINYSSLLINQINMQTRDSTNKSPIKLSMHGKINWHSELFMNGENLHGKNLQLNLYPNTQLDLFCSDNFSFWCTAPSMWLINCADPSTWLQSPTREGCWLQSSSIHSNDEDQENAWSQNPTVHKQSNFFTRKMN